ncbi:MAG: sulfite exporter TauE/SafE family protein [Aquificaceae bacterium]|nr:sulfite exporter TauE/SafE family protein [Aquificaceae bacterium]
MELLWGFVVGLIFSTVGAAGGILAGVGHLSIFGIRDANLVKFYNQFLVALSPLISLPLYLKQKRVVFWLAFWLAVGSVLGASAGAFLSYQYLKDIRQYKYLFGLLTLFVGIKVLYEAFGSKKLVKTYKDLSTSLKGLRIELRQGEEVKSISIFNPFFVGFGIAMLSSAMGVGGGFLIVPYMLLVVRLLAYYVPGTAVLVVFITTLTGMLNYYKLGVDINWNFLLKEALGVWIGSAIGPYLSKIIGERILRTAIGLLLLVLGMAYTFGLL